MEVKIQDYGLKPLHKLYIPYFSPKFNSYEMDYAVSNFLINNKKVYKCYLILININTKILFALPIKSNTTSSVEITKILIKDLNDRLELLSPDLKINNIRADGDSKLGKILEDSSRTTMTKLGEFMYKRNSFFKYLVSQKITLYLNYK
jgi:hypothetical protein